MPTTRVAARYTWSIRCRTRSRSCGPRCCQECCARCSAMSAEDSPTWRCSRPGWSICPATASRPRRRRSRWTGDPTAEQLAALDAALPDQPWHVAVALCGAWQPAGWWGPARPATWADAVEAVRTIGRSVGVALRTRADDPAPWHPGRCAAILLPTAVMRVSSAMPASCTPGHRRARPARRGPARRRWTCRPSSQPAWRRPTPGGSAGQPVPAGEGGRGPGRGRDAPAAAEVEAALRDGAGGLLESLRLFDVYVGRAGAARTPVAGVRAAVPRARPHPDHRRGLGRARQRRRGGGPRTGAVLRGT